MKANVMKKTMATLMATAAVATSFGAGGLNYAAVPFWTAGIIANAESTSTVSVTASAGYAEGAYAEWKAVSGASGYNVYADGNKIDSMLIRQYASCFRADALGLKAGSHTLKIVPIINANDTVSIEQLDFDENDTLSAVTAQLCEADLLIILTDVDGLYDKNPSEPDAKHIPLVTKLTDDMINSARQKGSELASGGMITKLEAASIAGENGIPTVIINGDDPEQLYRVFEGTAKCTIFDLA